MLSLEFIGIGLTCILNRKLIPAISTYGHLTIKLIQLISIFLCIEISCMSLIVRCPYVDIAGINFLYIFKSEHVNEAERSL